MSEVLLEVRVVASLPWARFQGSTLSCEKQFSLSRWFFLLCGESLVLSQFFFFLLGGKSVSRVQACLPLQKHSLIFQGSVSIA